VEFSILGPLEVRQDGRPVTVAGAKVRALLALLVLHAGEPMSAERLAIGLWGEDAPASSANTVQVHVSRLRRALGDSDALATTPAGYVLRAAAEDVDAARFERLHTAGVRSLHAGDAARAAGELGDALALWRGPALAEFVAVPFAPAEIARLEEQRQAAVEARIDADLALGRHRELVGELQQRVTEQPLRERAYEQLMLALAHSDRQAEALAVYRGARDALVEGLGLEPGSKLRELERRILAQEDEAIEPAGEARVPLPPTQTIGREADLDRLRALLTEQRLITIVGPGGVGKTRLAIETARAVAPRIPGGADFVSLAAVGATEDVVSALVAQLGVVPVRAETLERALARHLQRREQLLVLDNFEHVLEAAPLVADLLAASRRLAVLVTSRAPLRLRAERVFRLEPLTLPDAVRQFAALLEASDHEVAAADADATNEICRRLDGLPLAIELAAGRVGLLTVPDLADRLRVGLGALGPGARDAPPRQRTLAATIAWSYDLATPEEQAAVAALSVFAGGCTVAAAEAVTGARLDVLDALVAKNLVVARDGRLALLETVREFARDRLADANAVLRRHCEYYLELAETAREELDRTNSAALIAAHDLEADNFRAALRWTLEHPAPEAALRLATALAPYWSIRELRDDRERWLAAALALDVGGVPTAVRAAALDAHGWELNSADRREAAEAATRAALAIRETLGDTAGRAASLCTLGYIRLEAHRVQAAHELALEVARLTGDERTRTEALELRALAAPTLDEALTVGAEAAAKRREAGNLPRLARLQASLAYTALYHDAPAVARELCAEALELTQARDDPYLVALTAGNAGLAALFDGDRDAAFRAFSLQLRTATRHGYQELLFEPLTGLGALAAVARDDEHAARLYGAARASSSEWHDPVIAERLEQRFFTPTRERLGAPAWEAAQAAGARLGPTAVDAALAELPGGHSRSPGRAGPPAVRPSSPASSSA
jgi:predicted ATPase/DNA-binding SARP family transcriptional activator